MIDAGAGNLAALARPAPVALARLRSNPGRLKFSLLGGTSGPNPQSEDVGRTVALAVAGVTKSVRVRQSATEISSSVWSGSQLYGGTGSGTAIDTAVAGYGSHSLGAFAEISGSDWLAYVTHSPAVGQLSIYKLTNGAGAWTLHNGPLALPGAIADGRTAAAMVDRQTLFVVNVPAAGKWLRIWRGTFADAPFTGAVTWSEAPYRIHATHDEDAYLAQAPLFDRRAANGFDAVKLAGGTVVLFVQDHAVGRTLSILLSPGLVWSDPLPVVPLDFADDKSKVLLCRMTLIGGEIYATGRISRPDATESGASLEYDALLRSRDGRGWSLAAPDSYIVAGTPLYGQIVYDEAALRYAYVGWTWRYATSALGYTTLWPSGVEVDRATKGSVPTGTVTLASDVTPPGLSDRVLVELGYDSDSNLVQVAEMGLDGVQTSDEFGVEQVTLQLRDLAGKRLVDAALPHPLDLWSQSKMASTFVDGEAVSVESGEARVEAGTITALTNKNLPGLTTSNPVLAVGEALRVWLPDKEGSTTQEAPFELPGVPVALQLKDDRGQPTLMLLLEKYVARDGTGHSYDARVLVAPGGTGLANNTQMAYDDLFLGRYDEQDELTLASERRWHAQTGAAWLRFSGYAPQYGERVELRIHQVDTKNSYYVRLFKFDDAGTTKLKWSLGYVVAGTPTEKASGLTAYTAFPLRLYLRWLYRQGRLIVWHGTSESSLAVLVDYAEVDIHPAREGGLGLVGIVDKPDDLSVPVRVHGKRDDPYGDKASLFFVPAGTPDGSGPTAATFPPTGALLIGSDGEQTHYGARSAFAPYVEPTNNYSTKTDATPFPFAAGGNPLPAYFDMDLKPARWPNSNPAYVWATHQWQGGVVVFDGWCVGGAPGEDIRTPESHPEEPNVRLYRRIVDNGARKLDLDYGFLNVPIESDFANWFWRFRIYPAFTSLDRSGWGPQDQGAALQLVTAKRTADPTTAIETLYVADGELDVSIAEAVKQVAAAAGVEVVDDKTPSASFAPWTTLTGSWTVTTGPDGLPALSGNGIVSSAVALTDGVLRARLVLGRGGVQLRWTSSDGLYVKFATGGVEIRDVNGDVLRSSAAYAQGAANGATVTARISVDGAFLSVWIDEALACVYHDPRLERANPDAPRRAKTLAFANALSATIDRIDLPEAYERLEHTVLDRGTTVADGIETAIGERRLYLLYRANRPPRLGTLTSREGLVGGAPVSLVGPVYTSDHAHDDVERRTLAHVRGEEESVEAARDLDSYGLRFAFVNSETLRSRDAALREARALLREAAELSETVTAEIRADYRIENEDAVRVTVGGSQDWIVDSSSISFSVGEEEANASMTLGLRKLVES